VTVPKPAQQAPRKVQIAVGAAAAGEPQAVEGSESSDSQAVEGSESSDAPAAA
jgi:hypothetical protein